MAQGRRPVKLDAAGFKLGHVPPNKWDDISPDMKVVYEARDRIRTDLEYEAIGDRTCTNCPADGFNMPHRQKHCPLDWGSGTSGAKVLPPNVVSQRVRRVADNMDRMKQGQPAMMLAEAEECDDM